MVAWDDNILTSNRNFDANTENQSHKSDSDASSDCDTDASEDDLFVNAVRYGSEGMGMDSPAEWDNLFEVLNDYYRNPTPTNVAYQVNPAVELGRTERVSLNNVSDVPMSGLTGWL